jgi:hypothetical protein
MAVLTVNEADAIVSVVNSLIERYCAKYPDEFDFDELSIGYDNNGNIFCANGDDLTDTLEWVNSEVIPDLIG